MSKLKFHSPYRDASKTKPREPLWYAQGPWVVRTNNSESRHRYRAIKIEEVHVGINGYSEWYRLTIHTSNGSGWSFDKSEDINKVKSSMDDFNDAFREAIEYEYAMQRGDIKT